VPTRAEKRDKENRRHMTETNTSRSATATNSEPEDTAAATPEPETPDTEPVETVDAAEPVVETPAAIPAIYSATVREPGQPEASPDGRWLAYLYPAGDGTRELWLSPVAGGEAVRLDVPFQPVDDVDPDTGRQVRGPQWSPEGSSIAVTGLHPDGDRTAVWLVTLDVAPAPEPAAEETAETPEATAETSETAQSETAEPVSAETDAGDADTTVERAGQGGTQAAAAAAPEPAPAPTVISSSLLIDRPDPMRSPRWSPDGALMLVVVTRDGVDQVGLAQPGLEGVPPIVEPLTAGVLACREPAWSRDGRFVAWTQQHGADRRFADICTFEPRTGEMKNLTAEQEANVRHSLDWVSGRNLIGFVTRDGDWLGISVINADNKAGWMVTREAGDKWGHRFAPDEARLVYIRSEGFSTALVERGLHGSNSVALDPGEGVVTTPTWVGAKRVAYGFAAPQKPLGLLVQATEAEAEREVVALPGGLTLPRVDLRHPTPIEFEIGPEEVFSGLLYQTDGLSGPVPGAVYVPDGPLRARLAGFQREEQALASSGFAVLSPVIHGASGFGTAVEDDLADFSDSELEATDLIAAGAALGERESVVSTKLALVGNGYGGTLAMVAAGARPGVYRTVVAIDPITDWVVELDQADAPWRNWVTRQYGLPLTDADRYALRSPETFAGVIDAELVLVSTAMASAARQAQMATFREWLEAEGIPFRFEELDTATPAAALYRVGQMLAESYRGGITADDV
jgi:dipeptidyl aminopeptidase/acylaminoacyl peptidase